MTPLWKALVSSTPPTGVDLAAECVPPVPSRTWLCDSRTFKRLQATRRSRLVISPVGLLANITYTTANLTDATYTAFIVALSMAFNDNGISFRGASLWLTIADLIGSVVYMADLWMGFQLGFIARWEGRAVVVQNWAASARYYMRLGTFWTDMLACLPIFAQIAVTATGSDADLLRLIATLRLLRLIRVLRLLANLSRSSVGASNMRVLAAAMTTRKLLLLHAVFSLAVLVNLLGCIWWNVAVSEGLENSWAAAVNKDFDLLTADSPTQWLVSCYFALTTIVTIGYGDIVPVTVKEVAMVMVFQLVGVAMFAYLLNTASTLLAASGPAAKRAEAIRDKLEEVEITMSALKFAPSLRRGIRRYFALAWEPPDGCGAHLPQLFGELPPALRHKLAAQQLLPVLKELRFFPASMRSKEAAACCQLLAAFAEPLALSPGQMLEASSASGGSNGGRGTGDGDEANKAHAPAGAVYILCTGRMVAETPASGDSGGVHLPSPAVLGLADLLSMAGGELQAAMSSLSPPGWQHAAVATTHCNVWRLDARLVFTTLTEQQPALLAHLARRLLGWLSDGTLTAASRAALQPQEPQQEHGAVEVGQQEPQEPQQVGGSSLEQACLLLKRLAAELDDAALAAASLNAHRSKSSGRTAASSKQLGLQRATAASSAPSGWEEGEEAEEAAELQAVAEPAEAAARVVGFVWGD